MSQDLGALEPVGLRDIWSDEARDFTTWLEKADNLQLLGTTLGLELELEEREKGIKEFSADLVCRDNVDRSWVLIENQLELTDHRHLGQTLTYAAGLDAVTIIWIAKTFREAHRATVDWLNEITDQKYSFFALEVELWRIDDSRPAPKFNVVARPNDWTAQVNRTARGEVSDTGAQHEKFWTALSQRLRESGRLPNPQSPRPESFTSFTIGRAGFALRASRSHQKGQLQVALRVIGPDSLAHYKLLELEKATIDSEFDDDLEWIERESGKECVLRLSRTGVDPTDENQWDDQIAWMSDTIHQFYDVFNPMIGNLDASDWTPEDNDDV